MYAGSSSAAVDSTERVSRAAPADGTRYATSCSPTWGSLWTVTTAASTCGDMVRTRSISPSSIRKPRTFTWKSLRPIYVRVGRVSPATVVQRARSPVRYIRLPGVPNGFATNRSAERSLRWW